MSNQQSNLNLHNDMYIHGKSLLTKKGWELYNHDSTKWDILRVLCWMQSYQPEARELNSGDYFSGPKFYGDPIKDINVFKLTISKNYECIFQQVKANEENLKRMRKDIELYDFTWFKTNTGTHTELRTNIWKYVYIYIEIDIYLGEYFFSCWA